MEKRNLYKGIFKKALTLSAVTALLTSTGCGFVGTQDDNIDINCTSQDS